MANSGPSTDWIMSDEAEDADLEPWQRVMRDNAKKAKVENFIELLRGILGPNELTNLAGLARDMDLQHKQKLYMQQWAEQKGEATVAALAASGSLGGPPGVGPPGVGAAPPGMAISNSIHHAPRDIVLNSSDESVAIEQTILLPGGPPGAPPRMPPPPSGAPGAPYVPAPTMLNSPYHPTDPRAMLPPGHHHHPQYFHHPPPGAGGYPPPMGAPGGYPGPPGPPFMAPHPPGAPRM